MPIAHKQPKSAKKPLESEIQSAICQYLALKGYFFWRQNTGSLFREGRFFSMPKYSMNGIPDIILIKDGAFIGIEVKREKGVLNDAQLEFNRLCVKNGATYLIARSIDDLIALGL